MGRLERLLGEADEREGGDEAWRRGTLGVEATVSRGAAELDPDGGLDAYRDYVELGKEVEALLDDDDNVLTEQGMQLAGDPPRDRSNPLGALSVDPGLIAGLVAVVMVAVCLGAAALALPK